MGDKLSGVFEQTVLAPANRMLGGFPARFPCPVSRYTTVERADIEAVDRLELLAESDVSGPCFVADRQNGDVYSFNHPEYDADTLLLEYRRDLTAEPATKVPANYFPGDDPSATPINAWRPYGYLLFGNWVNELYQDTPFDLDELGRER